MCWLAYRESYGARVEQLQSTGCTQALEVDGVECEDGVNTRRDSHGYQPGIMDVFAQNLRSGDNGFPVQVNRLHIWQECEAFLEVIALKFSNRRGKPKAIRRWWPGGHGTELDHVLRCDTKLITTLSVFHQNRTGQCMIHVGLVDQPHEQVRIQQGFHDSYMTSRLSCSSVNDTPQSVA